jgi:hypothetical protein
MQKEWIIPVPDPYGDGYGNYFRISADTLEEACALAEAKCLMQYLEVPDWQGNANIQQWKS